MAHFVANRCHTQLNPEIVSKHEPGRFYFRGGWTVIACTAPAGALPPTSLSRLSKTHSYIRRRPSSYCSFEASNRPLVGSSFASDPVQRPGTWRPANVGFPGESDGPYPGRAARRSAPGPGRAAGQTTIGRDYLGRNPSPTATPWKRSWHFATGKGTRPSRPSWSRATGSCSSGKGSRPPRWGSTWRLWNRYARSFAQKVEKAHTD
jgi:hypothetical protein